MSLEDLYCEVENLAKTYSNIAHCYNKRKKYQESIEASLTIVCWSRGRRWRGTMV